jgi:hypothetical protein
MRRIRQIVWATGLVIVLLATTGAPVLRSQVEGQSEFQTITGDDAALERLPATPFVFWAYAIVWLVLIGYVFMLWRQVGRVEQDLAALTARLEQRRR